MTLKSPRGKVAAIDDPPVRDVQAIQQCLVSYCRAIDVKDWNLFAECFTADATAYYDQSKFVAERITSDFALAHDRVRESLHRLSNVNIRVIRGDHAKCSSYVDALLFGDTRLQVIGTYEDQLVRTDRGWKIQHRVFTTIWRDGDPGILNPAGEQQVDGPG